MGRASRLRTGTILWLTAARFDTGWHGQEEGVLFRWLQDLEPWEQAEILAGDDLSNTSSPLELVRQQRILVIPSTTNYIQRLPDDMLLEIAQTVMAGEPHRSARPALTLSGVCRRWREAFKYGGLWKDIRLVSRADRGLEVDALARAAEGYAEKGRTSSLVARGNRKQMERLFAFYANGPSKAASLTSVDVCVDEGALEGLIDAFGGEGVALRELKLVEGVRLRCSIGTGTPFVHLQVLCLEKIKFEAPMSVTTILSGTPSMRDIQMRNVDNVEFTIAAGQERWTLKAMDRITLKHVRGPAGRIWSLSALLRRCAALTFLEQVECVGLIIADPDVVGSDNLILPNLEYLRVEASSGEGDDGHGQLYDVQLEAPMLRSLVIRDADLRMMGLLFPSDALGNKPHLRYLRLRGAGEREGGAFTVSEDEVATLCRGLAEMVSLETLELVALWPRAWAVEQRILEGLVIRAEADGGWGPCPSLKVLKMWPAEGEGLSEYGSMLAMARSRVGRIAQGVRRLEEVGLYLSDRGQRQHAQEVAALREVVRIVCDY